jgi:hypothetical protein
MWGRQLGGAPTSFPTSLGTAGGLWQVRSLRLVATCQHACMHYKILQLMALSCSKDPPATMPCASACLQPPALASWMHWQRRWRRPCPSKSLPRLPAPAPAPRPLAPPRATNGTCCPLLCPPRCEPGNGGPRKLAGIHALQPLRCCCLACPKGAFALASQALAGWLVPY